MFSCHYELSVLCEEKSGVIRTHIIGVISLELLFSLTVFFKPQNIFIKSTCVCIFGILDIRFYYLSWYLHLRNFRATVPKDPRQQSYKAEKWKIHDLSFSKHKKVFKNSAWVKSYMNLKKYAKSPFVLSSKIVHFEVDLRSDNYINFRWFWVQKPEKSGSERGEQNSKLSRFPRFSPRHHENTDRTLFLLNHTAPSGHFALLRSRIGPFRAKLCRVK